MKRNHISDKEISELLDGFYPLTQKQKEHLSQCEYCKKRWEEWNKITHLVRALPTKEVPPSISINIMTALTRKDIPTKSEFRINPTLLKVGLALSSLAVIVITVLWIQWIYPNYRNSSSSNFISYSETTDSINEENVYSSTEVTETESIDEYKELILATDEVISVLPEDEVFSTLKFNDLFLSLAEETDLYEDILFNSI